MDIHFLGGATTVTGSRFLLTTSRARIVIDCGMFQGSPNESIRNRIPLGFDPKELDAILITHAHLDHCGLLPVAVREGYSGPIRATKGTIELANLVLLDSGRLHEEFAKREARWERRHPDKVQADDAKEQAEYSAAVEQAATADAADEAAPGEAGRGAGARVADPADEAWDRVGTRVEPIEPAAGHDHGDPEAALRGQPP